MSLSDQRSEAADIAVRENYDFGTETVAHIDWDFFADEENEHRANVYLEDPENDASKLAHAIVRFEPDSADIVEVYAHVDGNNFGEYLPPSNPAPGL